MARVLGEATAAPRRRQRDSSLAARREVVESWLNADIPTTRMLELARRGPPAPYSGGASTFYRFVARLRAERDAGAAPVIRRPFCLRGTEPFDLLWPRQLPIFVPRIRRQRVDEAGLRK